MSSYDKSLRGPYVLRGIPSEESLCDALVGGIGKLSYEMAKDYVDDFIAVSEESIAKAVSFLAKEEKYIVEAASSTTVAAVMDYRERIGEKTLRWFFPAAISTESY